MRAAVFHRVGSPLTVETVADPVPGADQAIVEVVHSGICGSDLHRVESDYSPAGLILGHEFAGTIAALGKDVTIRYSQAYTERDFEAVIDTLARSAIDVRPIHTSTVSLDELPAAFEALRSRPRECNARF